MSGQKNFKITKKELEEFALALYDKACHGYLDLKEPTCSKMVDDFLEGKEIQHKSNDPYERFSYIASASSDAFISTQTTL